MSQGRFEAARSAAEESSVITLLYAVLLSAASTSNSKQGWAPRPLAGNALATAPRLGTPRCGPGWCRSTSLGLLSEVVLSYCRFLRGGCARSHPIHYYVAEDNNNNNLQE